MHRFFTLLRCSHPLPVAAVTAATTVLGISAGVGGRWPLVLATVLLNQLSVGLANDYLDRELDRRAGRKEKPLAVDEFPAGVTLAVAVAAGLGATGVSLLLGPPAAVAQLVMLVVAQAYNLGLKRTVFSALPYAIAFGMIPLFLALTVQRLPQWWAVAAAALLGAGAHFTQSLSDIESDRAQGMWGLPARLGPGGSLAAAALCLCVGAGLLVLGPGSSLSVPGRVAVGLTLLLTAAVVAVGRRGHPLLAFRINLAAAAMIIAGLVLSGQSILAPVSSSAAA